MSTYWYFECLDHVPHLRGDEFTQHTDDAAFRLGMELALARPLDHAWWDGDQGGEGGHLERNARLFLGQHPTCRLGVVNEYRDSREDIPGTDDHEPCTAETWSWNHFRPEQVDAYWIRCGLSGPHDEHQDGNTGLTWRDV